MTGADPVVDVVGRRTAARTWQPGTRPDGYVAAADQPLAPAHLPTPAVTLAGRERH